MANLFTKSFASSAVSVTFVKGVMSVSFTGPSGISVSASADVADLVIDGLEKVIPGVIAKAVLEEARLALDSVQ